VASNMKRDRSIWPSSSLLRQAAIEIADPTVKTLRWSRVKRDDSLSYRFRYGDPRPEWSWVLALNDEAKAEFARLGSHWRPADRSDSEPTSALKRTLGKTPMAGRSLMERITTWVDGEMPRARQLAEAAAQQARLAEIESAAILLEEVIACECRKLIDAGETEDKILDVILNSGLDAARQEGQRTTALKSIASKKKRREAEARRVQIIWGEGLARAGARTGGPISGGEHA
jgi:hypothetical protein